MPGDLCRRWTCEPGNPDGDVRGCVDQGFKSCPGTDTCHFSGCDDTTGQCLLFGRTGTPCDDGNVCTTVDRCQAGVCVGGGGPVPTCDDSTVAGGTILTMKNGTPDAKDRLLFELRKGPVSTLGDLGDPFSVGGSGFIGCLYDQSGLLRTIQADAGGLCDGRPCWTPKGPGVRYRDKAGSAVGGADLIDLLPGPRGTSRFTLRAHGGALSTPAGPLTPAVTFQLRRTNTLSFCVGGTFSTAIRRNDAGGFNAKSD